MFINLNCLQHPGKTDNAILEDIILDLSLELNSVNINMLKFPKDHLMGLTRLFKRWHKRPFVLHAAVAPPEAVLFPDAPVGPTSNLINSKK